MGAPFVFFEFLLVVRRVFLNWLTIAQVVDLDSVDFGHPVHSTINNKEIEILRMCFSFQNKTAAL